MVSKLILAVVLFFSGIICVCIYQNFHETWYHNGKSNELEFDAKGRIITRDNRGNILYKDRSLRYDFQQKEIFYSLEWMGYVEREYADGTIESMYTLNTLSDLDILFQCVNLKLGRVVLFCNGINISVEIAKRFQKIENLYAIFLSDCSFETNALVSLKNMNIQRIILSAEVSVCVQAVSEMKNWKTLRFLQITPTDGLNSELCMVASQCTQLEEFNLMIEEEQLREEQLELLSKMTFLKKLSLCIWINRNKYKKLTNMPENTHIEISFH